MQTIKEWRQEGVKQFGSIDNFKFVCPRCSRTNTTKEFVEIAGLSLEEAIQVAPRECLGRYTDDHGCKWASYGRAGTLGRGRRIVLVDGKIADVFEFPIPRNY